jgi:uncharacterized membrane protein YfcA
MTTLSSRTKKSNLLNIMTTALLISLAFSVGFFFESAIGFGGGIIAYTILGFLVDTKEMVLAGLYIGTCSSVYIYFSDPKSFDKKSFISALPICFIGTIIGVLIFTKLDSQGLLAVFGFVLIFLSIKSIFFDKIKLPKIFRTKLLLLGGIVHGMFGTGGPFFINALKDNFQNKSNLRTTMAVFFVFFNLVRLAQLSWQGQVELDFFISIWWVILPVFVAIWLGHKAHLKISEIAVKRAIGIFTGLAGIKFLLL